MTYRLKKITQSVNSKLVTTWGQGNQQSSSLLSIASAQINGWSLNPSACCCYCCCRSLSLPSPTPLISPCSCHNKPPNRPVSPDTGWTIYLVHYTHHPPPTATHSCWQRQPHLKSISSPRVTATATATAAGTTKWPTAQRRLFLISVFCFCFRFMSAPESKQI